MIISLNRGGQRLRSLYKDYFNLRSIIIFVMPVSIVLLLFMLYNLSVTVENLSVSLIKQTITKTETQLDGFFKPVSEDVKITAERVSTGLFSSLEPEKLNPFFIPYVQQSPQVSSVLLGNSLQQEYLLLEEDSSWQNRITKIMNSKKQVDRFRWKYDVNLKAEFIEKWHLDKDSSNNPLVKPWYQTAILNPIHNKTIWTKPYIFKTTKDLGITASYAWKDKDSVQWVFACDVMLTDISNFTTNLHISEHGLAFVFGDSNKLIGLPADERFLNPDSIRAYVLKSSNEIGDTILSSALDYWVNHSNISDTAFSYTLYDEVWWCEIKPYSSCNGNTFYIGVIVPEKDFMQEVKKTRTVFIGGFLLVLILTLLVIRAYNQKRKDNILLAKQKTEIESQRNEIQFQKEQIEEIHKELKSSILYAERIQKAALPKSEVLANYVSDFFILFKPRDIVSGDFYWMYSKNEYLIATVADCTGHGVPGAFMSMLGISFLNEIVSNKEVFNAADILNNMREKIIHTLEQKSDSHDFTNSASEVKDGMDMSLVVINTKMGTLQYAGANNPLLMVASANPSEILTFKADKMPVAISDNMKDFSCIEIPFANGDQIYMLSDGFPDQFGGPNGKKFMIKQLKDVILKNSSYDMPEQNRCINVELNNWKSFVDYTTGEPYRQIDDICMMALKLKVM